MVEAELIVVQAWLAALILLPAWVFVAGWRLARLRFRTEGPHRHAPPAPAHLQAIVAGARLPDSAGGDPVTRRRAFEKGVASARGFKVKRLRDVPRLLARHYRVEARLGEDGRLTLAPPQGALLRDAAWCEYVRGVLATILVKQTRRGIMMRELVCGRAMGAPCVFEAAPAKASAHATPAEAPSPGQPRHVMRLKRHGSEP